MNKAKTAIFEGELVPLGQAVDCDVCIAKAGEPCYLQTSADEHSRTGWSYYRGNSVYGKERFHAGVRLKAQEVSNE